MTSLLDLYDVKRNPLLRGRAKAGCVRPTLKQFLTSTPPKFTCQFKYAEGGTVHEWTDGVDNYKIHVFTEDGTFIRQGVEEADIFVLAGGGGSGGNSGSWQYGNPLTRYYYAGAGGGGGGVIDNTDYILPLTETISVTVGNGGNGGNTAGGRGSNGQNSTFGSLTAIGGGGGGGSNSSYRIGNSGGSGGGSINTSNGAAGTAGQGNRGGGSDIYNVTGRYVPGGGGGAGAVGGVSNASPVYAAGGKGGNGIRFGGSWVVDAWTDLTGMQTIYIGTGGYGGGILGSPRIDNAYSPPPNSGSGGNGGSSAGSPRSAAGSSGIVIVRYKI